MLSLSLASGASAVTTTFTVGTFALEFDPGKDYCALNEDVDVMDDIVLQQQRELHRGVAKVVSMFVQCSELETFRSADSVTQYRILIVPYIDGSIQQIRGVSQSEYLYLVKGQIEKQQHRNLNSVSERVADVLDPFVQKESVQSALTGIRHLGILSSDDMAIYHGVVTAQETGVASDPSVLLVAETFLHGYPFKFSIFQSYSDQKIIDSTLQELRTIIDDFLNRNKIGHAPLGRASNTKPESLFFFRNLTQFSFLIAIFGGGAILVLFGFFRYRQRKSPKRIKPPISNGIWFLLSIVVLMALLSLFGD